MNRYSIFLEALFSHLRKNKKENVYLKTLFMIIACLMTIICFYDQKMPYNMHGRSSIIAQMNAFYSMCFICHSCISKRFVGLTRLYFSHTWNNLFLEGNMNRLLAMIFVLFIIISHQYVNIYTNRCFSLNKLFDKLIYLFLFFVKNLYECKCARSVSILQKTMVSEQCSLAFFTYDKI